jgi:predicted SAM-dependent methyltransferase
VLSNIKALRFIRQYADRDSRSLKLAVRNLWNEIKIVNIANASAICFRSLKGQRALKIHLGCGSDIKAGWINIDLSLGHLPKLNNGLSSDTVFINHDLRSGLPLEDGSCKFIYSSHFFEHLEYQDGLKLMRDCYRVLEPRGVFRIVLPDIVALFEAYRRRDESYFELLDNFLESRVEPETKTQIDYVNFGVYQAGEHKYIYDEEKLMKVLYNVGYTSVARSSYQEGIDLADALRLRYSFYLEAVK